MKRRRFLTGMAGAALAAPFLPSLNRAAKGQTAAAPPRRLVIFYTNNGCLTNRWFPKNPDGSRLENGPVPSANLAGTTLAGLSPYASKLLFPGGLALFPRGQVSVNGVTYFDPHDQGMGSKLTGSPIDPVGSHWALSPSLDHVAAGLVNRDKTTPPLVLSVGNSFANVKGIVSYKAAQTPFSPETRPQNVYNKLTGMFSTGTGTPTATDFRILQGNSILDCVRGDLVSLRSANMSRADQQRLSTWEALIRRIEVGMPPVVSAECNATNATNLGITADTVKAAGTSFTTGGDMMINLIALTMMCDANRSIILQWPGFAKFTWDGMMHEYDHHGLSHRNGSAAVGGTCAPNVIENLNQIDNWYAGRYAKLVGLINSIGEGSGTTMLDNSMVMWLPELADGNAHNNNNLPIVIAGSAGGYLKQGQAVNLDTKALGAGNSEASCVASDAVGFNTGTNTGNVPINKLHVTLLNALGREIAGWQTVSTFGMVDANGAIDTNNLLPHKNPGELTGLKA